MEKESYSAVIVEDESSGRRMLLQLLEEFCPEIKVVASSGDIDESKHLLLKHKPELVFLDIRMPSGNTFELIDSLKSIDFDIIFTTAYDEYALKAFRIAAIDYLMKPIEPDELIKAVNRFKLKNRNKNTAERIRTLLHEVAKEPSASDTIGFPVIDGIVFYHPEEIMCCDGDGSYTRLRLDGGKEVMLSKNIGQVELLLDGKGFFRVHNSHIINMRFVQKYVKNGSGYIILKDGTHVDISRRKKDAFMNAMNGFSPQKK